MNIEKIIKETIAEQLDIKLENIKSHSHLIQDLKMDSLDKADLIVSLEKKFQIQIEDEKTTTMLTVQDFMNYIKKKTL